MIDDLDSPAARYGMSGWWTRLHVILAETGPGECPPAWYTAQRLRHLAAVAIREAERLEHHAAAAREATSRRDL